MVILQYNLALVRAPVQYFSFNQCATCWQLSSDCFPDTTNQILPHLLLMLQNMCSAWLLFSSHSPFPGQEQPGLKIHAFEKSYSQNNSKPCASQGPPAGQESLCSSANHTFKQNWRKANTIFWHLLSPRVVVLSRPGENYTDSVLSPKVSAELRFPYVFLMKDH